MSLKHNLESLSETLIGDKKRVDIQIKPFKKGSFDIEVWLKYAPFIAIIVPVVMKVGEGLIKSYRARKKIKGQEPKSVTFITQNNNYDVEIYNGDHITIEKEVYEAMTKNKTLEKSTSAQFKSLDQDKARVDVEISVESEGEIITENISKEELANLAKPLDLSKFTLVPKQYITSTWLTIGNVDFLGDRKAKFIDYSGNEITAEIRDMAYLEKIKNGELSFKAQTRLHVRLQTIETPNIKGKSSYEHQIIEVIDIKQKEDFEQLSIEE
jgi:predicted CopG family antitoxin